MSGFLAAVGWQRLQFRYAEVENLSAPIRGDEDVLRLEIAVNDALAMRCGKATCNLTRDIHGLALWDRTVFKQRAQLLTFKELGNDVWRSLMNTDVIDGQDIGVVELPGRSSLLFEPAKPFWIRGIGDGQHLDSDIAAQP